MLYATAKGAMPLQVQGQPFAEAGDLVPVSIEAMSGQVFGRNFSFVPGSAESVEGIRVVLAFSPARNADGAALCRGGKVGGGPAARVDALAAFCNGTEALAEVEGWVGRVAGPRDPRFRALLAQMTRDLFGNNDEERQQRDGGDILARVPGR